ncbi:LysR substrate-binding domain-containing protein [Streptomyces sp. NPDC006879]|uniref:LysR substrate-binding domain-containing protein n=1 Tax=Streptomyces sp. NPDC006879 TaxID=3364767 RepID=UPI00369E34A2
MTLERHEIEGFIAVAEELHFGRAAERLLVSRSHISQTIKKLERRIGAPLFERTSRRVALTPLGRQLHEELTPHHRAIGEAVGRAIASARGTTGTITVGFVGALWGHLFVDAADIFRAEHPGCEVLIREVAFGVAQTPLRTGEVQLMNASFPVSEPDLTTSHTLVREPRLLAVSARHPLAARALVTLDELAEVTMLTTPTMPDYWAKARTPQGIAQGPPAASLQEALALISADKGCYPVGQQVTRFYQRPDISYIPIQDAPPLEWGLVWRKGGETPILHSLTQAVARVSSPLLGALGPT